MDSLTNLYTTNYFFYPICYFYSIIIELHKENIDYIATTYSSNDITNDITNDIKNDIRFF